MTMRNPNIDTWQSLIELAEVRDTEREAMSKVMRPLWIARRAELGTEAKVRELVAQAYRNGAKVAEICRAYGSKDTNTVYTILKESGLR